MALGLGPATSESHGMAPAGCNGRRDAKDDGEPSSKRIDDAVRRQSHARRVRRTSALARSLDCHIVTAMWLHSLTPRTLLRLHRGLAGGGSEPLIDEAMAGLDNMQARR